MLTQSLNNAATSDSVTEPGKAGLLLACREFVSKHEAFDQKLVELLFGVSTSRFGLSIHGLRLYSR